MSLDDVTERPAPHHPRLEEKSVPYAVVGGQAVALWVATREPAAVRTTKDVDLLIRREDLPRARAAAHVGREWITSRSWAWACSWTATTRTPAMPSIWSGPARKSGPSTNCPLPRSTNGSPLRESKRFRCPAWC